MDAIEGLLAPVTATKPKKPKTLTTPAKRAAILKKVKAAKPKAKKKPAKKTVKKSKPKAKAKPASTVVRSERLDMRLSKGEKAKLVAKAKKLRRTVTSIVYEAIEKIK